MSADTHPSDAGTGPGSAATRAEEETTGGIDQGAETAGAQERPTPADDYEANAREAEELPTDLPDETDGWDRPDRAAIHREEESG